jgi:hypothetical protein
MPPLFYFNLETKTFNTIDVEWLIKDGWRITETLEKQEKQTGGKPKFSEPCTLILLPCPEEKELNLLLKSHDLNSLIRMEMAQKLT